MSKLPLVMVPGMDGDRALRLPLLAQLSQRRPVHFVEYPKDLRLGYAALTDLAAASLPSGPFVLLGESFGGPIAVELAARLSDRAMGLILAATFVRTPLPPLLAQLLPWLDLALLPHRIVEGIMLGSANHSQVRSQFRTLLPTLDHRVLQARARDALQCWCDARLSEAGCPVLCLAGRHDWLMGRRSVAAILAVKPTARVCWLDAPHMLLETHSAECSALIETFCSTLDRT